MPSPSHRSRKRVLKGGWIEYQEGGLGFKEDLVRIERLLHTSMDNTHWYEVRKIGITWYVRSNDRDPE